MKITFLNTLFLKSQHLLLYGLLMAILVFTLKWLQWEFLILDNSWEIYVGLIAIFFTIFGVWIAKQLIKPKTQKIIVEKKIFIPRSDEFTIDKLELKKMKISNREYEVLQLLAKGNSNTDIAEKLFLSLSTVKTHVYNLFKKMGVKNRIQTIEKARRLNIIE